MDIEFKKPDGVRLILIERLRQIKTEGWSPEHDDQYTKFELLMAAEAYLTGCADEWPWDPEWWKPTPGDRIKELVKAGALIAAEIDRLQRKEVDK